MFEFTLIYEAADIKQQAKHCKKLYSWSFFTFRLCAYIFIFLVYSLIFARSESIEYIDESWRPLLIVAVLSLLLWAMVWLYCRHLLEISLDSVASLGPVAMRIDEWGVIHDQSGFKSSVPWHKFYRHVENSTHIMLFMAPRVGIIIKKSDLPEGQAAEFSEFVRQHLPATALSAR